MKKRYMRRINSNGKFTRTGDRFPDNLWEGCVPGIKANFSCCIGREKVNNRLENTKIHLAISLFKDSSEILIFFT